MGFSSLVSNVKTASAGLGDLASDKLIEWLNDYKKATLILNSLGFTVGKFMVSMGLPPEVHTTLSGKIDGIQKDEVERLIEKHQNDSSTVSLLKALLLSKKISGHVEGRMDGVTLHVTLGVPPSIKIDCIDLSKRGTRSPNLAIPAWAGIHLLACALRTQGSA